MPFFRLLAVLTCGLLPAIASAQAWPTKPVRFILSSAAGSPPDALVRALSQRLQQRYGQAFIVENKPGANAQIGMQACAAAPPDGYTFCVTTNDSVSVNPHLYSKLRYDPDRDFVPVAILAWPNSVIVANSQLGVRSFKEVVALSKQKPGALSWASFGVGSSSHLYLEWIRAKTGWNVTHVPYNGAALIPATMSNEVQLTYLAIGPLKPHIDSGKLVPIAVAGAQRSTFLPDVPTFAEVGLGDFYVRTWFGMFAPAGTPDATVLEMNKASVAIVNDTGFRSTMDVLTLTPGRETPAEMKAYLVKDRAAGAELVKTSKVKLD
jgi:tripartite-type tricarboxylate transporter receptor subunit TctC